MGFSSWLQISEILFSFSTYTTGLWGEGEKHWLWGNYIPDSLARVSHPCCYGWLRCRKEKGGEQLSKWDGGALRPAALLWASPLTFSHRESCLSIADFLCSVLCLYSGALSSGDNPTPSRVTLLIAINNHKSIFPIIISYHYRYWLLCMIPIYIL